MKSLVAAIGALALATGVAQAQPLQHEPAPDQIVTGQTYDVAGRNAREDRIPTPKQAPNQGAGTSRSSDANQG